MSIASGRQHTQPHAGASGGNCSSPTNASGLSRSTGEGTRKHSAREGGEGTAHASFHSSSTWSKFSSLILKLQMMNSPTPCRGCERASKKALWKTALGESDEGTEDACHSFLIK